MMIMTPHPCSLPSAFLSLISFILYKNPIKCEPSLGRWRKRGSEVLSDLPEVPPQVLLQCSVHHNTGQEAQPTSQSCSCQGGVPRGRGGLGRVCWENCSEGFFMSVLYTVLVDTQLFLSFESWLCFSKSCALCTGSRAFC